MPYRPHEPPSPLLIGYDPARDLPDDHLARFVEQVVEGSVVPARRERGVGQPPFDPRLLLKVLLYGYATGVRSSRQLERLCRESLPYLFLVRGDGPSYRTLCAFRVEESALVEQGWVGLFAVAEGAGIRRLGRITLDSTKLRADASPEAVVKRADYARVRAELQRILAEAEQVDAREEAEGAPGETELGQTVAPEQMRGILRRVRKQQQEAAEAEAAPSLGARDDGSPSEPDDDPPPGGASCAGSGSTGQPYRPLTGKMRQRIEAALGALSAAEAEGRAHLCLTDPDARMMYGERERGIRESHSFEVAVDNGLLVVGQSTQATHDNTRLTPLVEAASRHEPDGVVAVDADSGYYGGDAVGQLLVAGVDTCIPDSNTAGDLHRGRPIGTTREQHQGEVSFVYEAAADVYHCPEGNVLRRRQRRKVHGQTLTTYRTEQRCKGCKREPQCLTQPNAVRRTLSVSDYQQELEAARQRFATAEHQERYRRRAQAVETVFGFLRATLGYTRWWVRGKEKVAAEARLFTAAYQLRKVHGAWAAAGGNR